MDGTRNIRCEILYGKNENRKKIRIKSPNPNSRKYNPLSPSSPPSFSPPPVDGSTLFSVPLYSCSHPVSVSSLPLRAQLTSDPPFVQCLSLGS